MFADAGEGKGQAASVIIADDMPATVEMNDGYNVRIITTSMRSITNIIADRDGPDITGASRRQRLSIIVTTRIRKNTAIIAGDRGSRCIITIRQ